MQNREKIKEIYDRQVDRVYRTAMVFMKNTQDAEDIVQSVFLTLIRARKSMVHRDHKKPVQGHTQKLLEKERGSCRGRNG